MHFVDPHVTAGPSLRDAGSCEEWRGVPGAHADHQWRAARVVWAVRGPGAVAQGAGAWDVNGPLELNGPWKLDGP